MPSTSLRAQACGFLFTISKASRPYSTIRYSSFPFRKLSASPVNHRSYATTSDGNMDPKQFLRTSGATDSVWIHTEPYSNRPQFSQLEKDIQTDVCVIGSGIAGIQISYELTKRGVDVVMIEARDILSGESGRTTGHLSHALDGHSDIASKHGGSEKARLAGESHQWAIERIGEVSKELGIDCEYRHLPAYQVSQYANGEDGHDDDVKMLKQEVDMVNSIGLSARFTENQTISGWDGKVDQRGMAIYDKQATFHPTKYMIGVLKHLQTLPNFRCYTHTRMMSCKEHGLHVPILDIGSKSVTVETQNDRKINCKNAVQATCVPLQKLSVIVELEFQRTYAIAIRVPKGSVEDCLIYDTADPYTYLRITSCDEENDFLIVGGEDHKVGQEGDASGRYAHLEKWTRDRFPQATTVDYRWSGQVFESVDFVAFIGLNQGNKNIYIVTGDCGDGLTHGVLAGKLIADQIQEIENPWSKLYDPKRLTSIVKSAGSMIAHDVQINAQYKRFLQSDIEDVGQLKNGEGGVLNPKTGKPLAVYKDEQGNVRKFSALCPHLKGVVCWNQGEQSWDCPIHGSRFGRDGVQIIGPSLAGLGPADEASEQEQKVARDL